MYVVMKLQRWKDLSIDGKPLKILDFNSIGFLQVYNSLEEIAQDFEDGDECEYIEIQIKGEKGDEGTYH